MAKESHCPQCGAELPANAPEGLCPRCLMKGALEPSADVTADSLCVVEGPGTVVGRYELLEMIGEGGMGLVYLAEQKEPVRRRVALKIIKPGMDSKQVIARFETERQVLALLDHPNIARVFDAGTTETGRPYFVMEYVKGMSITQYCDRQKLDIEKRLKLFSQVCYAVQHAHQKGIIHRDIKPSNILVSVQDDRAVPKTIDFGVAKAVTQPLTEHTLYTRHGQLLGTPEYMSPEQTDIGNRDIDTRADIYSLGVVLYELLTGVLPFERDVLKNKGFIEVQRILTEEEPPHPSIRLTSLGAEAKKIAERRHTQVVTLARRLHRELEWIPLKAMRKDRSRRYRSASELADDIRNYLDGAPLLAGPETAVYRVKKFVQKHAGSVATVVLVAALIVLGLVVSSAMYIRAEKALQKEAVARGIAEEARDIAEQAEKAVKEKSEELRRTLYVNSIQLADAKYGEGNIRRVRELLDACPNDLRGWEWYRLNHIQDQSLMTFRGHIDEVSGVAVSPDGKHVVSGSSDDTIKVWDLLKGTELLTISRKSGNAVTCLALSPDGRRVVAGDNAGQIDVWDVTGGEKVMTFKGHDHWVSSITFSPDGTRIVSGSWDGTTKIWNAVTGTKLSTHLWDTVASVAFSPDGKRIALGAFGNRAIKVLDAVTTEELMTLRGKSSSVSLVAFSPDGKQIVSAGYDDNTIKVWDSATGAEMMTLRGHEGWVSSVAFSLDGRRIVSSGRDNTIKVWDITTGENMFTLRGHGSFVSSVAFTPDGKQIVSGSWDNTIKVWDVGPDRDLTRFVGHKEKIFSVAFSPDGRRIVSASQDGMVKVWDVQSVTEVMSFSASGGGYPLYLIALSPDGKLIASPSNWDNTVKIRDAATGVETLTLRGHEAPIMAVTFSPDGKHVASGGMDKTIKIWEAATAKQVMTLSARNKAICTVVFSPDGKRIASALDWGGEIEVWDAVTGANLMTLRHDGLSSGVAFSPDGSKIACGSQDGIIKVWDCTTGAELMARRGHAERVTSVAFSPDGKRIVSGSRDRTAKIWDSTTGDELLTLRENSGLCCVTFSPDGKSVAGGGIGPLVLWESDAPAGGYEPRRTGAAARKIVDELYEKHGLYHKVIDELKADETLDEAVRKVALQIANARLWEDAEKLKKQSSDSASHEDAEAEQN